MRQRCALIARESVLDTQAMRHCPHRSGDRVSPGLNHGYGTRPLPRARNTGKTTWAQRLGTEREPTNGHVLGTNRRHNHLAASLKENPAGTEVPAGFCSRRCSLQTGGNGLFQRSIDVGEDALNRRAEAVDDRNDRERDTCRDQTVFNGGRRLLIHPKLLKKIPQSMPPCQQMSARQ